MDILFKKVLHKKTSKYSDITNKFMFHKLFLLFYNWILIKDDLIIINNTLRLSFYTFLCRLDKCKNSNDFYISNDSHDYIVVKYSEEIVELFLEMKEITKSYGSLILHEEGRTSDDLLQVLIENVELVDEYTEEEINEKDLNDHE
tara:strand:- start:3233 stop:3667 length:435 start_codon:yes stop_codon:yes gene_type:complete